MDIYLDSNATTAVLPSAQRAAMAVMADEFGNPSSTHCAGLRARAVLDGARATAARVMGASRGRVLFTSGATEGIHTAVLSALASLRTRDAKAGDRRTLLLYGATEHKAVPQALQHWNALLGLSLELKAIPVGRDGRHKLDWLRLHAKQALLVCTMAANNETGVISDLQGIAQALEGSGALWMVDSVQALGKLALRLDELPIDYAPCSGHKLFAPKGVGLLYVRDGAPFTPLLTGGGQESGLRAGTENMAGIAALGAVLSAVEQDTELQPWAALVEHRHRLLSALRAAFPGIELNAPLDISLPTTLNFSVPGLSSKLLLDLFDAAGLRVSSGSACSASKALPSDVLEAMGLPEWQTASAVRLSFDATVSEAVIAQACERILACGASLRASCIGSERGDGVLPPDLVTRFQVDGACCYLVADHESRRAVVIDPLPQLTAPLAHWFNCTGYVLAAVLDTHSHGDHASSAQELRQALPPPQVDPHEHDPLGWPLGADAIALGGRRLTRLAIPGHTEDSTAYLLHDGHPAPLFAFVGDTVMPGALGRSDFAQSAPLAFARSLQRLEHAVGREVLLLPGHDYDNRFACTFQTETAAQPLLAGVLSGRMESREFADAKAKLERTIAPTAYHTMACGARVEKLGSEASAELPASELAKRLAAGQPLVVVDVREAYEQRLGAVPAFPAPVHYQAAPLSTMVNMLPQWLAQPDTLVLFFCRSGNRSAQAARALRRLGHRQAWSLAGGVALWPRTQHGGAGSRLRSDHRGGEEFGRWQAARLGS